MQYAGVDEVGLGALAGPIVVVAVALSVDLPFDRVHRYWPMKAVKDSKKTTPTARAELSSSLPRFLIANGAGVGIGVQGAAAIDRLGYSVALRRAQIAAIEAAHTDTPIDMVIADGDRTISGLEHKQVAIPKADGTYWVVAAASIIAKIYRDNIMCDAAREHPHYGWTRNKGYATQEHIDALLARGSCQLHRSKPVATVLAKHR